MEEALYLETTIFAGILPGFAAGRLLQLDRIPDENHILQLPSLAGNGHACSTALFEVAV